MGLHLNIISWHFLKIRQKSDINLKINIFLPEEIWRCTFSFSLSFFFNTILGLNFGIGSFFLPFWTWYWVKSCKILTPFTHCALCRTADWQCLIYLTQKKPLWFDEKIFWQICFVYCYIWSISSCSCPYDHKLGQKLQGFLNPFTH